MQATFNSAQHSPAATGSPAASSVPARSGPRPGSSSGSGLEPLFLRGALRSRARPRPQPLSTAAGHKAWKTPEQRRSRPSDQAAPSPRGARSPNDDAFPAPPALGAVRARSPSALVPRPEPAAAVAAAAAEELSGVRARGGVDAGCTLADTLQ